MNFEYITEILNNPNFPSNRIPNKDFYWHVSDTEELFEQNLKKYPDSPHLLDYLNNPIIYSYNNYGFRTPDDFNLEDAGNVFLGCSHTFGIGHHLKNAWSYKLSQKIGGKFYNISEPGSGIFTQYRYLHYFKDKIKFKNVFHFLPSECFGRYEFVNSNGDFDQIRHTELDEKLLNLMHSENQLHLINFVYINSIKHMLNKIGVNYYLVTNGYLKIDNINPYHTTMTPARDLMHYYVDEHEELCNIFYEKYKKNLIFNEDI